jgi:hypothetical protein
MLFKECSQFIVTILCSTWSTLCQQNTGGTQSYNWFNEPVIWWAATVFPYTPQQPPLGLLSCHAPPVLHRQLFPWGVCFSKFTLVAGQGRGMTWHTEVVVCLLLLSHSCWNKSKRGYERHKCCGHVTSFRLWQCEVEIDLWILHISTATNNGKCYNIWE